MITIQQHINDEHGGNYSEFARSVNASRPTVYRWVRCGAIWHKGRAWDPVTAQVSPLELEMPDRVGLLMTKDLWVTQGDCIHIPLEYEYDWLDLNRTDLINMLKELDK